MNLFAIVALMLSLDPGAISHVGDGSPLLDVMRPVKEITRNSFTLQYFTQQPTETRVQIREGNLSAVAWRPADKRVDLWASKDVRTVQGAPGRRTMHEIRVEGLKPGTRYFYRIYDPAARPTGQEAAWGAIPPWRREFAVATQAPKGRKTIIHLPVKVLLMTNVIAVDTAHGPDGAIATPPPRFTDEQLEIIRREFFHASRFFWVNNGMRLWVDFHIFVDDRWQRWGDEPDNVDAFYKGWPVSRAYPGEDFRAPGGGEFNIVDTSDIHRHTKQPVYEEVPYAGQIEVAFLRRWNANEKKWEFRGSGGGTLGIDSFPRGIPSRCQYLGGGDTAWLTTHEFHHSLESMGSFGLANREDDRIVFDHFEPRARKLQPDGRYQEMTWTTSGRHGEHYDGIAFWDRTLTDAQWLRFYFGEAITVADSDMDGIPDNDPRLPLDEKRFGSDPRKVSTDGVMSDLHKVMLSTWVPCPLQFSFVKPEPQHIVPNPRNTDTDGDGLRDGVDPYPLYPYAPFIYPYTATVDGDDSEWAHIPLAGSAEKGGMKIDLRQSHTASAYYGVITIRGPWQRVEVVQDGEGLGVFSRDGVVGFNITRGDPVSVRATWGEAKGLAWKAAQKPDGTTVVEFSYPNRGEGLWYWNRGGREIGTSIHFFSSRGTGYPLYETYRVFYARMIEPTGKDPLPTGAPEDLSSVSDCTVLRPGDPGLRLSGDGWKLVDGTYRYSGDEEQSIYIADLAAVEFDLWVRISAKSDGILGAFLPTTKNMSAGNDYIGFVGGYANTVTRMRLFGQEAGDEPVVMSGSPQSIQLSRRANGVWLLVDGSPIVWAPDPDPKVVVDRLAVIGGYGGEQVVYEIRYRSRPPN
ncbi:MAG: fibronectin type III domain-containing protein [Fimbriimonadia bacterium]|jgi:hypothetical protein